MLKIIPVILTLLIFPFNYIYAGCGSCKIDKTVKKSSVAQTIFTKVPILIVRNHKDKEEPSIDIHANRSHTSYLFNLLVDGTRNFNF